MDVWLDFEAAWRESLVGLPWHMRWQARRYKAACFMFWSLARVRYRREAAS